MNYLFIEHLSINLLMIFLFLKYFKNEFTYDLPIYQTRFFLLQGK